MIDAFCTKEDLSEINPPDFLMTTGMVNDIIPDGKSIKYVCRNDSLMVPDELDEDSNFSIDVVCSNGTFKVPRLWPPAECVLDTTCKHFPNPPQYSNLVRMDEKQRLRAKDKAYFVCKNPTEMIITLTGTNMFSASCNESKLSSIQWPNCTYDPVCDDIPSPSNDSLLVLSKSGIKVKLGEYVKYECKNKKEFFAIPDEVSYNSKQNRYIELKFHELTRLENILC